MDNRVIAAIEDYIFDLFEPNRNWPKYEFCKRSYARWAATEILNSVKRHPYISPYQLVEDFARKTDTFSGLDHDERNDGFIFLVAHNVATDILDILRAMN